MSAVPTFHSRTVLLVAIGLLLATSDASAQQMDPNMQMPMSMPMPAPAKKHVHTPTHAKKPARRAAPPAKKSSAASSRATPHEHSAVPPDSPAMNGMDMDAMPDMAPMDHSTMDHSKMDHSTMDHSTMDHSTMDHSTMDHSTMDHSTMDHSTMDHGAAYGAAAPRTPIPTLTDADRAAAKPPAHDHPVHDSGIQSYTLLDRLETSNAGDSLAWNGRAWIGGDINRLWLRTEGARVDGRTESADLEVLAGHSIAPWWDVVAGIRHDFRPGGAQDFVAIGVQGVAPYKIEVDATAYVGQGGQTAARIDVEYESLLTNRLILQPHVEFNLYGQDDPDRDIGSGLSTVDAGLRLRYEVTRRFAPYIGVVHERAFGGTATLRRDKGGDSRDTRIVAGVRIWF